MGDARIYRPFQHTVKPQGCEHLICFANMELWMDKLPDAMDVGGILWVPDMSRKLPKKQFTYKENCYIIRPTQAKGGMMEDKKVIRISSEDNVVVMFDDVAEFFCSAEELKDMLTRREKFIDYIDSHDEDGCPNESD